MFLISCEGILSHPYVWPSSEDYRPGMGQIRGWGGHLDVPTRDVTRVATCYDLYIRFGVD